MFLRECDFSLILKTLVPSGLLVGFPYSTPTMRNLPVSWTAGLKKGGVVKQGGGCERVSDD